MKSHLVRLLARLSAVRAWLCDPTQRRLTAWGRDVDRIVREFRWGIRLESFVRSRSCE